MTLGCNSEPRGVTVTRTYIHLAIGSAFKQGAHMANKQIQGGVQNLGTLGFGTGIRSKLHASTNQGGSEHQGGEMNCKTRTWLMISEKMNGD